MPAKRRPPPVRIGPTKLGKTVVGRGAGAGSRKHKGMKQKPSTNGTFGGANPRKRKKSY